MATRPASARKPLLGRCIHYGYNCTHNGYCIVFTKPLRPDPRGGALNPPAAARRAPASAPDRAPRRNGRRRRSARAGGIGRDGNRCARAIRAAGLFPGQSAKPHLRRATGTDPKDRRPLPDSARGAAAAGIADLRCGCFRLDGLRLDARAERRRSAGPFRYRVDARAGRPDSRRIGAAVARAQHQSLYPRRVDAPRRRGASAGHFDSRQPAPTGHRRRP
jgi:hypothetical protein